MENNEYLLSVVIPTRNRQEYALQSVKEVLAVTTEKTQIVIQDNSDDNSLKNLLIKHDLLVNRVCYNYTSEVLSFVDNFSKGISFCKGLYVILIGDDDGVLPNIEKITQYALDNNLDSITSRVLVTYYWPHCGAKQYKCTEDSGYIRINKFNCKTKKTDNIKLLKKVLSNGCQFYHSSGLPKIYHGIVSKKVVDLILNKNGTLFSGLSPDIYSSFMIALYSSNNLYIDYPFSIDGNCKKSGAGAQAQGKHTGKLKDAPHFQGKVNYRWDPLVPEVYSVQTIWADSGLQAIRDYGELKYINDYSLKKLTAYTICNNKSIKKDTLICYARIKNIKSNIWATLSLIPAFLTGPIPNILKRIFIRVKGLGVVGTIVNDVNNIEIASMKICDILKDKGELEL